MKTTKSTIKQTIRAAVIIGAILITGQATATDLMKPGGPFNPYVIEPTGPNTYEMKESFPAPGTDLHAPGQAFNPLVIERQPDGSIEVGTKFFHPSPSPRPFNRVR